MYALEFTKKNMNFAIYLEEIEFIEDAKGITKILDTSEVEKEFAMLRGKMIPIYNFDLQVSQIKEKARFLIVINIDEFRIALEADDITGILYTEEDNVVKELPKLVQNTCDCFQGVLAYQNRNILIIDIKKLRLNLQKSRA